MAFRLEVLELHHILLFESKENFGHFSFKFVTVIQKFPVGSDSKESAYKVGVLGLILGLGRSPGKGNGNPLQYSCLENSMDRGARWATVHGVAVSWT